jgi:hypothetical protein
MKVHVILKHKIFDLHWNDWMPNNWPKGWRFNGCLYTHLITYLSRRLEQVK